MLAEPVARGHGLGLEAVALMMQYAAEELQTKVGTLNPSSLHTLPTPHTPPEILRQNRLGQSH